MNPTAPHKRPALGIGLVVMAAVLWGTLGTIYTLSVGNYGLPPLTVVLYRAAFGALAMGAWLLLRQPAALRLRRSDAPLVVAYGVLGVTIFYVAYIYAVLLVGVTTSVVLLYTAPIIVAVLAWRFLGEHWSRAKGVALLLTIGGIVLVSGAYNPAALGSNALGLVCGLLAGATYALYSIFGKLAHARAVPMPTLLFYTMAIGTVGLILVTLVAEPGAIGAPGGRGEVWGVLALLGTAQTLVPIAAYTAALHHLDAGVASMCAMLEPVVAGVLALVVLNKPLGLPELVGAAAILGAVGLLTLSGTRPPPARQSDPPAEPPAAGSVQN